jgi:hypothetical protein
MVSAGGESGCCGRVVVFAGADTAHVAASQCL